MTLKSVPLSMNRAVVGQASRLPPRRLAPGFVAGETPATTAGTAAPLLPRPCSWSQCAQSMAWGLSTHEIRLRCSKPSPERPGESSESKAQEKLQVKGGGNPPAIALHFAVRQFTTKTQFCPPNSLGTRLGQLGSSRHSPSTR